MGLGAGIRAGKAFVEFVLSDKKLEGQLRSIGNRLGSRLQAIGAVGSAAIAPVIAAFTNAVHTFVDFGGSLDDVSKRTDVAASKLAEWNYAAEQTGASLGNVENALTMLRKKGIDAADFENVAEQIRAIEDPTLQAKAAIELFGKTLGKKLLPMIRQLPQLTRRFYELNLAVGDDQVEAADNLGDAWGDIGKQLESLNFQIGSAVSGPLKDYIEAAQGVLAETIEWVKKNPELVATTAKAAFAIAGLAGAAFFLGTALTAVALNPVAFAIGALIALAAYFAITSDEATLFGKALDGIITAAAPLIDVLKELFEMLTGIDDIYSKIGNFLGWTGNTGPSLQGSSGGTVANLQAAIQKQAEQVSAGIQMRMRGVLVQPVAVTNAATQSAIPRIVSERPSSGSRDEQQNHQIAVMLENILRLMRGSLPRTVPADP